MPYTNGSGTLYIHNPADKNACLILKSGESPFHEKPFNPATAARSIYDWMTDNMSNSVFQELSKLMYRQPDRSATILEIKRLISSL